MQDGHNILWMEKPASTHACASSAGGGREGAAKRRRPPPCNVGPARVECPYAEEILPVNIAQGAATRRSCRCVLFRSVSYVATRSSLHWQNCFHQPSPSLQVQAMSRVVPLGQSFQGGPHQSRISFGSPAWWGCLSLGGPRGAAYPCFGGPLIPRPSGMCRPCPRLVLAAWAPGGGAVPPCGPSVVAFGGLFSFCPLRRRPSV